MCDRYLKKFESFNPNGIVFGTTDFEITHDELTDLLIDIADEFPDIEWFIESSRHSKTIEMCKNSFIVILCHKSINDEWGFGNSSIAYIEPGIYEIIKNINSQLAAYDLYISHNDFEPFQQSEYELVISKIGTEPVDKRIFESIEKDDDIIYPDFDENMMLICSDWTTNTSNILILIPIDDKAFIGRLVFTVKYTLSEKIYKKLFNYHHLKHSRNPTDFLILFITTIIDRNVLDKISKNVDNVIYNLALNEYALPLEINNRLVLLIHSEERGSSIRIHEDNFSIKKEEVVQILKSICELLNKKL